MTRAFVVDANYRFIAASQELNARITQRQHMLTMYITLNVSLLATLVALRPTTTNDIPPIEWLILGFPLASICFALLNYTAERAITNLRSFLSELECLEGVHLLYPSYNTTPKWSAAANKARRVRDTATVLLVCGCNVIGLGAAYKIYTVRLIEAGLFLSGSIACSLLAIIALLVTGKFSYRPAKTDLVA